MRIILTHDVDSVSKSISHVLKRWRRFSFKDILMHVFGLKSLYNNLRELEKLEDKYGYRSTIFVPVVLFPISRVSDQLLSMADDGWEIGLHFVVERHQLKSLITMERDRLEDIFGEIHGVRTHMLAVSDRLLEEYWKAGFMYDSSIRVEECGRYETYRVHGEMVEIPIGIMDADLFGRMNMSEKEAWRYITRKIENAERMGAPQFTILFHQESLKMKGGRLYEKLLEYLSEKSYKVSRCIDALRF